MVVSISNITGAKEIAPHPLGAKKHGVWLYSIRQRFNRNYLPDDRLGEVKHDEADVTKIYNQTDGYAMSTKLVAEQFEISRLQVQQLAKEYRDAGSIPKLEIPGQKPYATHPDDRSSRVLAVHEMCGGGAVAVAKVLRVRDDVSLATYTFPEILTDYNNVTKNTNKPARQRL